MLTLPPGADGFSDNTLIAGEWLDVPRGINDNAGKLNLQIVNDSTLEKISQTGGFAPSTWKKIR